MKVAFLVSRKQFWMNNRGQIYKIVTKKILFKQTATLTKCQLLKGTEVLFPDIAQIKWRRINKCIDVELFIDQ